MTAACWLTLALVGFAAASDEPTTENAVDIGARRELFVDALLIDRLEGTRLKLHEPRLAPPVSPPRPHGHYATVLQAGNQFQFYYRGDKDPRVTWKTHGIEAYHEGEVTLYAESQDASHWTLPKLGLYEHPSFPAGNIVLMNEFLVNHNFAPFLDARPGVASDARFKALAGTVKSGLVAFVSGDGIHWRKLRPEPVITYTKEYAFDSQNVSFWSESEGQYVCYFRHFLDKQLRSVCRTTSPDFTGWTEPVPLRPNFPGEHLYTTLTQPYFRAPHIYLATPTRFHPSRGESTDILFMTARGDGPYDRTFREAFIRPGLDPARWGNRSNYAAWNVVPTGPAEMSIYTTPFRRFTLRLDGFASVHAGADAGEVITHTLRFAGKELVINCSTSAGGSVRIELQTAAGQPIPGFALADSVPFVGDAIEQPLAWRREKAEPTRDLASLAGQPVRLRFQLVDADLYSIQFR